MLEKAKRIQQESKDMYTAVEAKHDGSASEWFLLWKELSRSQRQVSDSLTTDERYCWVLKQIDTQRTMLESANDDEKEFLKGRIQKTENEIKKMQKKFSLMITVKSNLLSQPIKK